jgi:NADPH:quinone reductase
MPKAVRFHQFGGVDVLQVEDVPLRALGADEVVVDVRAAAINPGEVGIRSGALESVYPTTLPCGQGTDLAGVISKLGDQVSDWQPGDEVIGWSWERSSQAEQVVVPANQLVRKPAAVSWEVAGTLGVAGTTAVAAVAAVDPGPEDTVLVSGATGGVGCFVVQLLKLRGARVIAIASERQADWLRAQNAHLVPYGDGLLERVKQAAPGGIDAAIDLFGPEYVQLAVELGVSPQRIDTIISFEAAGTVGAKTEGSTEGTSTATLSELATLIADGKLEVPIAARYPLTEVRSAFVELEQRHTFGKIVLIP